jgi:hypothetical protein
VDDVPSFFSTRLFKFLLITSSLEEESSIIPFALHCAVHHPLARIEVLVQNLNHFKRNHDMILKLLDQVTSLSQDWLLLSERSSNEQPAFIDDSEFIISIDPRNLFVDEQLPNVLVYLLGNQLAITVNSSCLGSVSRVTGNVTIRRAHSFTTAVPVDVSNLASAYNTTLHKQLINVYAVRDKQDAKSEQDAHLVSALYATQRHKLLQSMLPLFVPHFTEKMARIETIFPKTVFIE